MSEGKDSDYKPKTAGHRRVQQITTVRPRRNTRKDISYKDQPIQIDSEEESTCSTIEGVVGRREGAGVQGESDRGWSDTASDITVKSEEFW